MFRNNQLSITLTAAAFILFVGLVGCSTTPQAAAPTNTLPPPTTANTAVPSTAETTASAAPVTSAATAESTASPAAPEKTQVAENTSAVQSTSCTRLNLNDTTQDKLLSTIPNFSNRMVREFFEYRPYVSILQFRREIGKYVDANQVAEYEKYVYVPVDPNQADAETLKQIPGVDDTTAAALTKGRPYASNQTFLDALGKSVNAQQLTSAACYLVAQS